jgi:hypothetical protein
MKECLWCGNNLNEGAKSRKKKYCDLSCRYDFFCAMRDSGEIWEEFAIAVTCVFCGKSFKIVKGMAKTCCSEECFGAKKADDRAKAPKTMPKISKFDRSACYRDGQCATYSKCSDAVLTGKTWLCEDGKDHFKPESREVFMRPIFLQ